MDSVKVSITGYKEIDNCLKHISEAFQHKILLAAHAAAAKPLVERMKLTAPEGPTGNLVDSIGIVKMNIKKADQLGEVRVGPRRRGGYKGFAGHLVEYGTNERVLKGKGKYKAGTSRGKMRKKPFVEPSFNQTKDQVENNIRVALGKSVARTMKKYLKK